MSVIYRTPANVQCRCGRFGVHCPQCGSIARQGLRSASKMETIVNPETGAKETMEVLGYRCRRCSYAYPENSPCAAPVLETAMSREDREEARAAVNPEMVNDLIAGLKRLSPERYGHLKEKKIVPDSGVPTVGVSTDVETTGVQSVNNGHDRQINNSGSEPVHYAPSVAIIYNGDSNEVDKKKLPPTSTVGDDFFG
jgi:hypothetical protein